MEGNRTEKLASSTRRPNLSELHGFSLGSLVSRDYNDMEHSPALVQYPDVRDRYRLGQLVGTGAYSYVKMAEVIETGDAVAIKIIKKEKLNRSQLEMVYMEAKALRQLQHPNVLKLFDVVDERQHICLVTEWMSMDSFDYINWYYNQLCEKDLKKIFKKTALAVSYCHSRGYMHRDIKPENILLLVDESGNVQDVKLADFGMVCKIGQQTVEDDFGTVGY